MILALVLGGVPPDGPERPPQTHAPTSEDAAYASVVSQYAHGDRDPAVAATRQWKAPALVGLAERLNPESGHALVAAVGLHLDAAQHTAGDLARAHRSAAFVAARRLLAPDALGIDAETRRDAVLATLALLHGSLDVVGVSVLVSRALEAMPGDPELLLARGALQETALAMPPSGGPTPLRLRDEEARQTARRALVDFDLALWGDPGLVEARVRRGRVLHRLGRIEEAREELQRAKREAKGPILGYLAALFLGTVLEDAGRLNEAEAQYHDALDLQPDCQAAYLALAQLRHRQGRFTAAGTVVAAMGRRGAKTLSDPFWVYDYGQFWEFEQRAAALRERISR